MTKTIPALAARIARVLFNLASLSGRAAGVDSQKQNADCMVERKTPSER
jgi:hypothetical protein